VASTFEPNFKQRSENHVDELETRDIFVVDHGSPLRILPGRRFVTDVPLRVTGIHFARRVVVTRFGLLLIDFRGGSWRR
jgi:hypothetical protein